jgi:CheY-like chemotaxis protein
LARKILLADDSVTAQNMGRKILADAGYEVTTVNNGSAALKKIAELRPELVILDVYMPGYSGLEVCQRLKDAAETARIPVLLSVGKLEPFKPEESQRVRADAFIVKPFEASELLGALAKLEDRIVPRPEPSKPGRFARAFAAIEGNAREPRNGNTAAENSIGDNAIQENGWKSRIAFPHEKSAAEAQEAPSDEDAIYNPVNRDLRTVVETPAEHAADEFKRKNAQPSSVADAHVDVAALVPPGLPKDVTPEEVAAIAAASVQIQRAAEAAAKEEPAALEPPKALISTESAAADDFIVSPSAAIDQEARDFAVSVAQANSLLDALGVRGSEQADAQASPAIEAPEGSSTAHGEKAQEITPAKTEEKAADAKDEPVTMALAGPAAGAGSQAGQWKAVPAQIDHDEANLTLEEEMRKAYAAFASEENQPASAEAVAEKPAQEAARGESSGVQPGVVEIAAIESARAEAAALEAVLPAERGGDKPAAETTGAEPLLELDQERGSQAVAPAKPDDAQLELEPGPAVTAALSEPAICGTALEPVDPLPPIPDAPPEPGLIVAETAASNHEFVSVVHEPEPLDELETVRNTAAAWESWRRLNEASEAKPENSQAPTREVELISSPAEAAAMAAAAGAEQAPPATAAESRNAADVASIVENLLADLRPRLMEEISRKMAEKK